MQTFLITRKSNYEIILQHIQNKIIDFEDLYNIEDFQSRVTFKYKEVKFDYNEFSQFNKINK